MYYENYALCIALSTLAILDFLLTIIVTLFYKLQMDKITLICIINISELTLKTPNKNCSRRHFNFLLLSFE